MISWHTASNLGTKQKENVSLGTIHPVDKAKKGMFRQYHRKQLRISEGKKMTATDERYMHIAEDALYLELGTALNMDKEQVFEYIIKEIEKDKKEQ